MQTKELLDNFKNTAQAQVVRRLLVMVILFHAVAGFWMIHFQDDAIKKGQADHLQRIEAASRGAAADREGK